MRWPGPSRGTLVGSPVALYAGGLEDNLAAQITGEPEKSVKKVSPSCNFMVDPPTLATGVNSGSCTAFATRHPDRKHARSP